MEPAPVDPQARLGDPGEDPSRIFLRSLQQDQGAKCVLDGWRNRPVSSFGERLPPGASGSRSAALPDPVNATFWLNVASAPSCPSDTLPDPEKDFVSPRDRSSPGVGIPIRLEAREDAPGGIRRFSHSRM